MFAISPEGPELGELQPLAEAIDELCEILGGERELVIEGLAEIIRRRAAFEEARRQIEKGGGRDA
ncbi:hypothetical protein [Methylobacterium haplocladii]|uniref:Uncharacterized protein n=1 Tax=Methylobacterium haplocladii TaxID=1176176 RepID=A0A512IST2_9HYPH|nr:hypothetical protein [Methylobacterium haplocladii]GEP00741.1 hypothetical protein MHA02_31280 [Methylobacterium haplocladii]GJD82434.1 hypothetical protein HPGCJGGD_0289 [Methylobacterium haplocladii]GLS59532.1 hypothetical protein GCM10007887_22010 [Methylobacterium haplocladii]